MLLNVNGEDIYYRVEGDGPPLVLIHGWTLDLRMWDQQVEVLRRRFLPWDGPGHVPLAEWQRLAQTEGLDHFRRLWATHPLMRVSKGHPRSVRVSTVC